jgi:hypothetical protein
MQLAHVFGGNSATNTGLHEGVGELGISCGTGVEDNSNINCYSKQNNTLIFGTMNCDSFPTPQRTSMITNLIEKTDFLELNIYPNPAKDQINFKFTTGTTIIRRIELYDALGSLILTQDVAKKDNIINIQSLPNGIYYYLIITDNKTIKNDKIVVIKYPNN